jgi:hypothetical protein
MKKAITIFLSVLYLASFSGMLLGLECNDHQNLVANSGGSKIWCNSTNDSEADNNHPFLRICKLVEVHKEVLVSGHAKNFRTTPVTLVSTNHVFFAPAIEYGKQVDQPVSNATHKLFLQHCVLLI